MRSIQRSFKVKMRSLCCYSDLVVEEGAGVEVDVVPAGGGVGEGGGAAVEGGEAEDGVSVGVRPEGPQVARRRLEVHQVELKWIMSSVA